MSQSAREGCRNLDKPSGATNHVVQPFLTNDKIVIRPHFLQNSPSLANVQKFISNFSIFSVFCCTINFLKVWKISKSAKSYKKEHFSGNTVDDWLMGWCCVEGGDGVLAPREEGRGRGWHGGQWGTQPPGHLRAEEEPDQGHHCAGLQEHRRLLHRHVSRAAEGIHRPGTLSHQIPAPPPPI